MEKAIPYCGDLHIDASTKKLILNLLASIRTVVPVGDPPELHKQEHDRDVRSQEYLRNIIVHARQNSHKLEGIFNPDELLRYTRYISDYEDLLVQLESIMVEIKSCRDSAWQFASRMAELLEGHIRMCTPQETLKETDDQGGCIPLTHDKIKLKVV
ncbi:hypothetical protein ACFLR8_04085 [Bacteroidota bacterium]